jgi:hypothetical protein
MTARTTVRLPQDLLTRAKRKAEAEGRTLTSLIEEGLRQLVTTDRRPARPKPHLPRVSKAEGGLLPGVELVPSSSVQETDDLDEVRRLQRGA